MIGVNVWWVYMAPQNIPRAISVLTLDNKVVLYWPQVQDSTTELSLLAICVLIDDNKEGWVGYHNNNYNVNNADNTGIQHRMLMTENMTRIM